MKDKADAEEIARLQAELERETREAEEAAEKAEQERLESVAAEEERQR